ncbi:MAG: YkvA family protein [Pseudomonadales bacterium]
MAMQDRTLRSRIYQEALKRAKEYLDNPDKLDNLLNKASDKSKRRNGTLRDVWDKLVLLLELLRQYRSGDYREVSTRSIMLVIASLLYFVIPVDMIPDFLFGFGYLDDIALFGWTITAIKDDLDKFELWLLEKRDKKGTKTAHQGVLIEGELVE